MLSGFVKERLTQARMIRGLSQVGLQALTSVSRVSISKYETGKSSPKPEIICALAAALAFPESFFFKPIPKPIPTPIFFRSLASQTKSSREQWGQHSELTDELLRQILSHLDFPKLAIPQISLGAKWYMASARRIEDAAYEARRIMGLGDGPIPHLIRLVENKGAVVARVDTGENEDGFSRWLVDSTLPTIFISKETTAFRDRMSIAHELGHLVLHRKITPTIKNLKIIEDQAKIFAAAFLMPAEGYAADIIYPDLQTLLALKKKWKVSIAAQILRCRQLGFLSEKEKKRLFIILSRKGWRRQEPFDDEIPVEGASLLKTGAKMLAEELGVVAEDLPSILGYSPSDTAALLGLPIDYFEPHNPQSHPLISKKVIQFKPINRQ